MKEIKNNEIKGVCLRTFPNRSSILRNNETGQYFMFVQHPIPILIFGKEHKTEKEKNSEYIEVLTNNMAICLSAEGTYYLKDLN